MESGDLGTWDVQRIVVVLEGIVAMPTYQEERHLLRKVKTLAPAQNWGWSTVALKTMVRYHYHDVMVDLITFVSEEAADAAADWLLARGVPCSTCEFIDYSVFTESLSWQPNVTRVIDSNTERLLHYGSRAYEAQWGSEF